MSEFVAPDVYVEEISSGVALIAGVETSTCAILGRARGGPRVPTLIRSLVEFEAAFGGQRLETPLWCTVRAFFANGGRCAIVVRVTAAYFERGLSELEKTPEPIGLVVLAPPRHGRRWASRHWQAAAELCERRRAFLIVDAPFKWRSVAAVDLAQLGVVSRNAAAYFPHLLETTSNGAQRTVAPGGAIAGVFARIDATRGVWKAPAGLEATIIGSAGTTLAIGDADNEQLTALSVNALRSFADRGLVAWGARTLATDPEWKYVPVRRLALFLEDSIARGLAWAAFEPNAEPTWAKVRLAVENFLTNLWRSGALQGAKPEHAFFVVCDARTLGELEIGFAPLKPAEFVILRLRFTETPAQ